MSEHMSQDEQMKQQDARINQALAQVKHKLLVMSGKGGVGKSTVAVNLAVSLAKAGYRVGLMDVDLHGPTVPVLLGLTGQMPEGDGTSINPIAYSENLGVISIGLLLDNSDRAVIWRGPLKIGAIRQFISDVTWGPLDYLIIDSPPGTGDEPLTVAQTIKGAHAVVVTTPQEVSLADVRKSINFCRQVNMPILGLIENMAGYTCPTCGHHEPMFGQGGGQKTAEKMGLLLLGSVPIDPKMVIAGDEGKPYLSDNGDSPASKEFAKIMTIIADTMGVKDVPIVKDPSISATTKPSKPEIADGTIIAVPTAEGKLCRHFGHCEIFTLVKVEHGKAGEISELVPPPHEPGLLPKWLSEQGAKLVITGGMGTRAQDLFKDNDVQVVVGAPVLSPKEVVEKYLAGTLVTGSNTCDH